MENKKNKMYIKIPIGTNTTNNPYCSITTSKINVDIYSDTFVYDNLDLKTGNQSYGLKKSLLWRLADAAGVQWDSGELIKCEQNSVIFKANAFVRGLDGSFTPYSTTKEFNILMEEQEINKRMKKLAYSYKDSPVDAERELLKNLSPDEWANIRTKEQVLIIRKNKVAIAETSSKLRLVRNILNLDSNYSIEELKEGFIVERVDFKPDLNDPEIKKMFIQIGFSNPLYKSVNKLRKPIEISDNDNDTTNSLFVD